MRPCSGCPGHGRHDPTIPAAYNEYLVRLNYASLAATGSWPRHQLTWHGFADCKSGVTGARMTVTRAESFSPAWRSRATVQIAQLRTGLFRAKPPLPVSCYAKEHH